MPILHFSSVSGPLHDDSLKSKINTLHTIAHTNKYRKLLAALCVCVCVGSKIIF
jgi:hypothetical protein